MPTPGPSTSVVKAEDDERRKLLAAGIQPNYGDVIIHTPVSRRAGGSTILEPVLILFLLAKALSDTVITNLLEYQTCRVMLELPHDNCTDPVSPVVEDLVQPTTAHIITGRALLEAFVPACMAVLIGPWSDANGRKPFLVISLVGMSITYLCWGCLSLLPNLYPHVFLLASLPMSLSGGVCAVYLLSYCYISDVTNEHTRSFRLSIIVFSLNASSLIGTALANLMVNVQHSHNPYSLIFFLSSFLLILGSLYTHWFIKESIETQMKKETRFMLFSHAHHLILAATKYRNGHAREMIFLIVASLSLITFVLEGETAIMYLSVRERFTWHLYDYSEFNCFNLTASALGCLTGVWLFSTVLRLPNMLVVSLLNASFSVRSYLMAEAKTGPQFYMAATVAVFITSQSALCRTELSRLVPKHELGKIFALVAFLEFFTPVAATPIYTILYERTYLYMPGTVFLLSCFLAVIDVVIIAFVFIGQRLVKGECYNTDSPPIQSIQDVD